MGELALKNLKKSMAQLTAYDSAVSASISDREDRLDSFADRADNFLISLSHTLETDKYDSQMNLLMQAVPDFERIGDYATNIDELAMQLVSSKVTLSNQAKKELSVIFEAVEEIVELTVEAFRNDDNGLAQKVEPLEEVIDDMVVTLRDNHTERLRQGTCTIAARTGFSGCSDPA
jgi:phosphate:Na+ symporter